MLMVAWKNVMRVMRVLHVQEERVLLGQTACSMMCLGQEMIWPFSVIAETAVELLWIDAKLFREVGMGSSEWTAGFS